MPNGVVSVPTITGDELSNQLAQDFPDLVWDPSAIAAKLTELANRYPGQLEKGENTLAVKPARLIAEIPGKINLVEIELAVRYG